MSSAGRTKAANKTSHALTRVKRRKMLRRSELIGAPHRNGQIRLEQEGQPRTPCT